MILVLALSTKTGKDHTNKKMTKCANEAERHECLVLIEDGQNYCRRWTSPAPASIIDARMAKSDYSVGLPSEDEIDSKTRTNEMVHSQEAAVTDQIAATLPTTVEWRSERGLQCCGND
jgi:hypothetical protein